MPTGGALPFSATGGIELTAPGQSRLALLSDAQAFVPPELYDSVLLFAEADTPGLLTPGQVFTGQLTGGIGLASRSTWKCWWEFFWSSEL